MAYTSRTPEYTINLQLPESKRWQEVISKEKQVARQLVREAQKDFASVPGLARWGFGKVYNAAGGLYGGEIQSWSEALDISYGEAAMLQCSYELSHLSDKIRPFGCTAGIQLVKGMGLVHVRSMDWPLNNMGKATRIFRFTRGKRFFYSVGMLGFVGVLSGLLPKRYSVTINYAPPIKRPHLTKIGPAFLVRDVLECCNTYREAVSYLKNEPLSTSVFFTVCGVDKGEACVIERSQTGSAIRKISGDTLVQGNHFVSTKFEEYNDDADLLEDSESRTDMLESGLSKISSRVSLDDIASTLDASPVRNAYSFQQMVFHPKGTNLKVWRWI